MSAGAEYDRETPPDPEDTNLWNIRTGALFPSGATLDDTEFSVGIEYEPRANRSTGNPDGHLTFSADWTRITTRTATGEDDVTLIPILVNWKQRLAARQERAWYYGLGAGIYWAEDPIPEMDLTEDASFAWQVMLGYRLNPDTFVEGRFIASDEVSDDALFGLAVGYSF